MRTWSLLSFLIVLVTGQNAPSRDPERGVSESLARDRAERVSDLRYDITLTIPADQKARIAGRELVDFSLRDASLPLALDFDAGQTGRVQRIQANSASVDVRQLNGHIVLPAAALRPGGNRVTIDFDAGDAPLNRNPDFLYTIFVPARAHQALPCFDQPDLKARWTLTLDVPAGWEAVGNGAETARTSSGGRTRLAFAQTPPLSTYLFAFAAGKFSVETAERNGRTLRMFHRETDAAKVARNKKAVFDLHASAIEWMQQYTAIPYPFGKFDFVLVPAFQFGGMEHAGAVFYNAGSLLLDPSATQNDLLERASIISHETAHMWFGDLVTMRWFDDVWLKEVFANFMAAKIVNPSFPTINHDLRFLLDYYPGAYDIDRTDGSNPIRQPLANLSEAGTLYGNIIYNKAPIVMRQLEGFLGPDAFRDGLREYLKRFSFGNATWSDLITLLDDRTPEDLAAWSRAWVEEDRRPAIATDLAVENGRIARLMLSQRDPNAGRGLMWNQQLDIVLGYAGREEHIRVHLAGASVNVADARGRAAPLFVLANGGGIAYGEIHLDAASRDWLSANVSRIADPLTRGSAWMSLWDAMLDGEVAPSRVLDLVLQSLPLETDEQIVEALLGDLRDAYWRFTSSPARTALAPRVERVLRSGLDAARTQSLKGAYFAALRNVAQTPATIAWLTSVWRERTRIPGLTLAETDYIALTQDLAVRATQKDGDSLVTAQVGRTKDPDRKAQLTFIRSALSSDVDDRDRFFASLADVANRRHEPWVLAGLRALHHPLRAESSEKYVPPSLAMLLEIQRTGDIFFPKRWTDSTLGGYSSARKVEDVRRFLAALPAGYPDRLKRIVLSSADDLFRSARLK
jgi:aminopeptidase N